MNVRIELRGSTTLVIPEGRLDFAAAPAFQTHVEQALAGKPAAPAAVIIDCALLEYVSSAGLRVFLLAARTAQRAACSLSVCGLSPAVREVFEVSGFSRLIAVHADLAGALVQTSAGAK